MGHAFLCVAYGMLHKALHANPLRCITLGLWFGGRLPAELRALGLGHGAPELAAARQRRGRSAASAEAIDVHGVCLCNNRQLGRRIKEGMHANLLSCINMEFWLEAWAWRAGAWSCAAAAPRRDAGAGLPVRRLLMCMEYVYTTIAR